MKLNEIPHTISYLIYIYPVRIYMFIFGYEVGLRLLGSFLESVESGGPAAGTGNGDTDPGGCRGSVETKLVKRVVACLDVRCGPPVPWTLLASFNMTPLQPRLHYIENERSICIRCLSPHKGNTRITYECVAGMW